MTTSAASTTWPIEISLNLGGEDERLINLDAVMEAVDPREFPVFWWAAQNEHPAQAMKIEWVITGERELKVEHNYQQICRQPFAYKFAPQKADLTAKATQALIVHMRAIEQVLVYGTPDLAHWGGAHMIGFCGGVRHYLGRDAQEGDILTWRPLRNPTLLLMRGEFDLFSDYTHHGEWVTEFSLEAISGKQPVSYDGP